MIYSLFFNSLIMKTSLTIVFTLITTALMAQNFFIAHRGASFIAPENTLASAKLAWDLGADAVECDIYLTADNRVMVMHEGELMGTLDRSEATQERVMQLASGITAIH